jgi:ribosomal peptide maturation radical SAM protein 1
MNVDLSGIPPSGDALLILPPFAGIDRPSFGLQLLQALGRRDGFAVSVLYANIHFAREIGEELYHGLCYADTGQHAGEKVFATAAFGESYRKADPHPLPESMRDMERKAPDESQRLGAELDGTAAAWLDALAEAIARLDYPIVGCNAMFEQTTATVGLFNRLRRLRPGLTLIVGGSLCEGAMAKGMASLTDAIDYVFSGESEVTFLEFLRRHRDGTLDPQERIFDGKPCLDLDALPNVDYDDFFHQIGTVFPESRILRDGSLWLAYEGSRGCWWGQKHHCTFCGINGTGMVYRQKSAERVHRDLADLAARYPARKLMMLDNIMPHQYFKDLLPLLKEKKVGLDIFYEQKANLTFRKLRALCDAGINIIQPGIESLADDTLRLMTKGVQARQNIALLRFARSVEVAVNWNTLYAFPGDDEADYRQSLELIPLLTHLNPPSGLCHLSIDRFSPYHTAPERYGIRSIWPERGYYEVYPAGTDFENLAYHFEGDYDTASRRDRALVRALDAEIERWRALWMHAVPPVLGVRSLGDDLFLIADTRDVRTKTFHLVDRAKAMAALLETRHGDESSAWAIENRLAVPIGDVIVPLAVADRDLFGSIFDPAAEQEQSRLAYDFPAAQEVLAVAAPPGASVPPLRSTASTAGMSARRPL